MKISTKGRYALTIMSYLAKNYKDDRYVSSKEISEKEIQEIITDYNSIFGTKSSKVIENARFFKKFASNSLKLSIFGSIFNL